MKDTKTYTAWYYMLLCRNYTNMYSPRRREKTSRKRKFNYASDKNSTNTKITDEGAKSLLCS